MFSLISFSLFSLCMQLHEACKNVDLDAVTDLLSKGLNVDCKDEVEDA